MLRYKNTYYDGPLAPYLCFSDMLKDQLEPKIQSMLSKFISFKLHDLFVHFNEAWYHYYVVVEVEVNAWCLNKDNYYRECGFLEADEPPDDSVECVLRKEEEFRNIYSMATLDEFKYERESKVGSIKARLETREVDDLEKYCVKNILVVEFEIPADIPAPQRMEHEARQMAQKIVDELYRIVSMMLTHYIKLLLAH